MAKRGQTYTHRLVYRYESGSTGRIVMTSVDAALGKIADLAPSLAARGIGGTFTILTVAGDGTDEELVTVTVDEAAEGEVVRCAYCRRLTAPSRQAAEPWEWPGRGRVTNCKDCAGIVTCVDGHEFDSSITEECPTCVDDIRDEPWPVGS